MSSEKTSRRKKSPEKKSQKKRSLRKKVPQLHREWSLLAWSSINPRTLSEIRSSLKSSQKEGRPEKCTERNWAIFKFLSIDPTRWPYIHTQRLLNAHPTIPHTPNWKTHVRGPFFRDYFSRDFLSRGPFFADFFPGFTASIRVISLHSVISLNWVKIFRHIQKEILQKLKITRTINFTIKETEKIELTRWQFSSGYILEIRTWHCAAVVSVSFRYQLASKCTLVSVRDIARTCFCLAFVCFFSNHTRCAYSHQYVAFNEILNLSNLKNRDKTFYLKHLH